LFLVRLLYEPQHLNDPFSFGVMLMANVYPAGSWFLPQRTRTSPRMLDCTVEAILPVFALGLTLLRFAYRHRTGGPVDHV
jgi:hypothetical protein